MFSQFLDDFGQGMAEPDTEELAAKVIPYLKQEGLINQGYDESDLDNLLVQLNGIDSEKLERIDAECIDEPENYEAILKELLSKAGVALVDVSIDIDDSNLNISCFVGESEYKSSWQQNDDWISSEFYKYLNQILESETSQSYALLPASDQISELMLVKSEISNDIEELLQVAAGTFRADPDVVTGFKVMFIFSVCIILLFVSIVVGWIFYGFWVSLGLSLLIWGGLATLWSFSVVLQNQKNREIAEELSNNPEMMGKLAISVMDDFKAGKL